MGGLLFFFCETNHCFATAVQACRMGDTLPVTTHLSCDHRSTFHCMLTFGKSMNWLQTWTMPPITPTIKRFYSNSMLDVSRTPCLPLTPSPPPCFPACARLSLAQNAHRTPTRGSLSRFPSFSSTPGGRRGQQQQSRLRMEASSDNTAEKKEEGETKRATRACRVVRDISLCHQGRHAFRGGLGLCGDSLGYLVLA